MIEEKVKQLIRENKTRDPWQLADALGLHIYERNDFDQLLGMYAIVAGRPCIFLNGKSNEATRRLVLAHEIGHDQLHRKEAQLQPITEFTLYQMDQRPEYEANVFAAHLLIDDEQLLQCIEEGIDIVTLAQKLELDINLVLIKLHEMRKKGYPYRVPDQPKANFLKDMQD